MISKQDRFEIFKTSHLIKVVDQCIIDGLNKRDFFGLHYPVTGQEIISATALHFMKEEDKILTTYRCLGEVIGLGIDPYLYFSEIMGRETGMSKGRGGGMHLCSLPKGLVATSGIVGGTLPICCGVAYAEKLNNTGNIVLASIGDGATTTGAFHESMNMIGLWDLPVIVMCINNGFALHSSTTRIMKSKIISDRAREYGINTKYVDVSFGLDSFFEAISDAIVACQKYQKPCFLEIQTYRQHPHMAGSNADYMSKNKNRDLYSELAYEIRFAYGDITFESFLSETENYVKAAYAKAREIS